MSEFAFFRFMSLNLLTQEEKDNKTEMISVTEEVLDAQGIECDAKIAKVSEETIREILTEVRKRRKKRTRITNELDEEQEVSITRRTPD
jgi:ribosomal protein S13